MRFKNLVKRLLSRPAVGIPPAPHVALDDSFLIAAVDNFEYARRRLSAFAISFRSQNGYVSNATLALHSEVLLGVVANFDIVEEHYKALQADEAAYTRATPLYNAVAARLEIAAEIFLQAAHNTHRINSDPNFTDVRRTALRAQLNSHYGDDASNVAHFERLHNEAVSFAEIIITRAKAARNF